MRFIVTAVTVLLLAAAPASASITSAQSLQPIELAPETHIIPGGAPAGGDWLNLPLGSIGGIRDLQCGKATPLPKDWNCDIGAGDGLQHRGNVVINYDVGRCFVVMDGHAHAWQSKIVFASHVLLKVCPGKRPWVKRPWRVGGMPPS